MTELGLKRTRRVDIGREKEKRLVSMRQWFDNGGI